MVFMANRQGVKRTMQTKCKFGSFERLFYLFIGTAGQYLAPGRRGNNNNNKKQNKSSIVRGNEGGT